MQEAPIWRFWLEGYPPGMEYAVRTLLRLIGCTPLIVVSRRVHTFLKLESGSKTCNSGMRGYCYYQ